MIAAAIIHQTVGGTRTTKDVFQGAVVSTGCTTSYMFFIFSVYHTSKIVEADMQFTQTVTRRLRARSFDDVVFVLQQQ